MNTLLEATNIWNVIEILTQTHGMVVGRHLEKLLIKEILHSRKTELETISQTIQDKIKKFTGE